MQMCKWRYYGLNSVVNGINTACILYRLGHVDVLMEYRGVNTFNECTSRAGHATTLPRQCDTVSIPQIVGLFNFNCFPFSNFSLSLKLYYVVALSCCRCRVA